jgi:hypothetical protein
VTEQYRLNKMRESQAAASVRAGGPPPPRPASASSAIPAPARPAAAFTQPPPSVSAARDMRTAGKPGLWARVRRSLFGLGKPMLDGRPDRPLNLSR